MKKTNFDVTARFSVDTYNQYVNRFINLALSRFEWVNLPKSCDERYLEMTLLSDLKAVFFKDTDLPDGNNLLSLSIADTNRFDVYGNPITFSAYSRYTGYRNELNLDNAVIIYDNLSRLPILPILQQYALRIYNIDRIIDVNANNQKTPWLIRTTNETRLSMKNIMEKIDMNEGSIVVDKSLDPESIKVLRTDTPFVSDKLYDLKSKLWNEALTVLGIANVAQAKKERLISAEVNYSMGGTIASRFSYLESRKQACKKINDMFGLDIDVKFREIDIDTSTELNNTNEIEKDGYYYE